MIYTWEHQIQYYETDQMRVAHHSNYIRWFEEARTYALDRAGFGYGKMEECGVMSPVVTVSAEYKGMSRFPETLLIETQVKLYNGVRLVIAYTVKEKETGEVRCVGESSHCFIDSTDYRLISLKRSHPEIHEILCTMTEQGTWAQDH